MTIEKMLGAMQKAAAKNNQAVKPVNIKQRKK